jgi:uncharacterized protein
MDFEWDEAKRQDNVRKHGVDFDEAMVIFEGNIIDWIDDREDYGEERLVALGRAVGLARCVHASWKNDPTDLCPKGQQK